MFCCPYQSSSHGLSLLVESRQLVLTEIHIVAPNFGILQPFYTWMRKRPNLIVRNSGVVELIHNTGLSTTVSMFYSFIVDIYTNHSSCRPLAFKYQLPVQWPQFRLSFNRSYQMRFTSYLIASRFTNSPQLAECVHSRLEST